MKFIRVKSRIVFFKQVEQIIIRLLSQHKNELQPPGGHPSVCRAFSPFFLPATMLVYWLCRPLRVYVCVSITTKVCSIEFEIDSNIRLIDRLV